jgi:hypothetical protein
MSIIHRKLKPVDQNVGDQALHVYRTLETETNSTGCGANKAFRVYHTLATETSKTGYTVGKIVHFMSIVHQKLKPIEQDVL